MKAVRVQYIVNEDYVDTNKANVQAVMDDLRANPIEGMNYSTYYLGEGRFMHLSVSSNPESGKLLSERESFAHFRSSLQQSSPVEPPKAEDMDLVASSQDLV